MKSSKSISYRKCGVKYCKNKNSVRSTNVMSYFTLPKDPKRRATWIKNCLLEMADENNVVKDVRVCQDHFENRMFLNVNRKNRLTDVAVPTLFNDDILTKRASHNETESSLVCQSSSLSSSSFSDSSSDTQAPLYLSYTGPKKLNLRKELRIAKDHIRTLENRLSIMNQSDSVEAFLNNCKKFLPPNLIAIIQSHLMEK